jgi:opacity protein-like surface antigen
MRKLIFLVLVCSTALSQPLKAQYYFYNDKYYDKDVVLDLGASFGIMNCLTDLGGKKTTGIKNITEAVNWKNSKPSFGAYIMAMYREKIGVRLQATFGEVNGADSTLKNDQNPGSRYESNLSFKSKISDIQLGVEIHPLMFLNYDDVEPPRFSPYVLAGVGYYSFDPQAQLNGQWYSLQPLRTEGQGFSEYPDRTPYKLSQFNVAAGLGVKYELSSLFNARLEVNHRFLFTDYLDDVSTTYIDPSLFQRYLPTNVATAAQRLYSRKAELKAGAVTNPGDQRGSPSSNDAFFTVQLKVGIVLGRIRR